MRRTFFLVPVIAIAVTGAAPRSVWDGVYSKDQAKRGETLYKQQCAKCHAEDLKGADGFPELAGGDFLTKWNGRSANGLYDVMQKTMPIDDPGILSARQNADLLAYIFSVNQFPAGEKELDREGVGDIRIEKR